MYFTVNAKITQEKVHDTDGIHMGDTPPATRNDDVMTRWNFTFIVSTLAVTNFQTRQ